MLARRLWTALCVLLLAALSVTACTAPVSQPAPGPAAPATVKPAATAEQVFTVAIGRDPGPLNPHDYSSQFVALAMVYEPLVVFRADGTLGPGLAESWEVSKDGLTYTLRLRKGVTFHDGTPFNAAAAKWNLQRWLADDQHSYIPSYNIIDAKTIQTPDDYTVVLKAKEPYFAVLQELSLVRPVRMLSPKAVDAAGKFTKPMGTGPWKLAEYVPDQRTVFVPYENYWGAKPKLQKVVFEVISDPQARIAALLSDGVNLIGGEYLGGVSLESIRVLQSNPKVRMVTGEGSTTYLIGMNFRKAPFNDVLVRRAINYAIDRDTISKKLFVGLASPATGVYPTNIPYVTHPKPEVYSYKPDQAKALLAQAGWKLGTDGILTKDGKRFETELMVDAEVFPQAKSMAEVVQEELRLVGIDVKLRLVDFGTWSDAIRGPANYDMATWLSYGPPYDPWWGLGALFNYSKLGFADDGTLYADPALDLLRQPAFAATDETARKAAFDKVWQYLDDNAAAVPVVYSVRVYAVSSRAQSFKLSATEYELDLSNVTMLAP